MLINPIVLLAGIGSLSGTGLEDRVVYVSTDQFVESKSVPAADHDLLLVDSQASLHARIPQSLGDRLNTDALCGVLPFRISTDTHGTSTTGSFTAADLISVQEAGQHDLVHAEQDLLQSGQGHNIDAASCDGTDVYFSIDRSMTLSGTPISPSDIVLKSVGQPPVLWLNVAALAGNDVPNVVALDVMSASRVLLVFDSGGTFQGQSFRASGIVEIDPQQEAVLGVHQIELGGAAIDALATIPQSIFQDSFEDQP